MKKVLFYLFLLLSVNGFSQFGNLPEKVITCGITGTDTFYVWAPFRADNYNILQVDFSDFSSTDSCLIDFFFLFESKEERGKYVPTQIEDPNSHFFPKVLKKSTFLQVGNSPYLVNDSTSTIGILLDSWKADGLGIEITKYSSDAEDSIILRPRR